MQPLVSPVDHEARSHQYDDDEDEGPNEYTPLLAPHATRVTTKITKILVALMVAFMLFGIAISVVLFIEQDKKWSINVPFEMVTRYEWKAKPPQYAAVNITKKPLSQIMITHTNTHSCSSLDHCKKTVKEMQDSYQNTTGFNRTDLPFNFLISPIGLTFEGRGWNHCGELDPTNDCTSYSIAGIGDFSSNRPPELLVQEFKAFLSEAIWRRKISPNYIIVGRAFGDQPKELFKILKHWRHWRPM